MFSIKKMREFVSELSYAELEDFETVVQDEKDEREKERDAAGEAFWTAAKNLHKVAPYYEFSILDEFENWVNLKDLLLSAGQI